MMPLLANKKHFRARFTLLLLASFLFRLLGFLLLLLALFWFLSHFFVSLKNGNTIDY